ncbi:MAG: hypothetical protein Fur005_04390 [Roseiflexaceae bacterium]
MVFGAWLCHTWCCNPRSGTAVFLGVFAKYFDNNRLNRSTLHAAHPNSLPVLYAAGMRGVKGFRRKQSQGGS